MIEEDINERMARFAPSQDTPGELRGPTVEEVRRMTMQPTASPDPALDMIRAQRGMPPLSASFGMETEEPAAFEPAQDDSAIEMIRQSRRERMSATFYGASMVNPDEAGKAQRIASEVGLGPDLVRRHMPEFERQLQMRDFRSRDLPQKDPVLAQFLADRQFAEIAHDDVGALEKFAPLMVDAYMLYLTGATLDMRKGAARARLMKDESWIGTKAMFGLATPADLEEAERLNRRAQNLGEVNILGTIAEQVELNLRMAPDIATAGVAGAAVGSMLGPGIGTALGFAAGTSAGIIATTAQLEGGLAYLQMRRDGVSEEEAIRAAVGVGLVNGVIELAGMKIASAPFKAAARRIMSQTAAKAITRPTVRRALAVAATEWGKQAGTEGLEEAAQEITLIAGERIAKAIDGIDPERSLEEEIPRVFESFIVGLQVGAVLGSAGPSVNLALDVKNATVAEQQQQMFERLSQLSVDNKVRARNPEVFERFMAAQAGDAGIPDIYVSASAMREVLAQSGLTKEQMDEALPGVRESLAQATDLRDDVVIPTARFTSRLAGTPLGDALMPHMRGRPNVASIAEMQQAVKMKPQLVQELEQATEAIDVARQSEDQQLRTIERKRLEELRAAGRDDAIAKSESRTYRAFVSTMANMLKITPERFESTFGLRGIEAVNVQGEDVAAPAVAQLAQSPVQPTFYSALDRSVAAIDAKSIAPSGWKERIKGLVNKGEVKQDEVDWSGLTDWLDMQEGKVTKEAVAEFLKNNGVRVERVQIGGIELENLRNEHARAEMEYDDALEAERSAQQGTNEAAWNAADARLSEARRRVSVLSARLAETEPAATKYGRYQLPGGKNYREVLITLPPIRERDQRGYKSGHWDQPNVLVHFRLNDRVDADGKRVLFVEEIQSDWGQAGRKKGFDTEEKRAAREAAKLPYEKARQEFDAAYQRLETARNSVTKAQRDILEAMGLNRYEDIIRAGENKPALKQEFEGRKLASAEYQSALAMEKSISNEVADLADKLSELRSRTKAADLISVAPFVETTDGWLNLGLKHILLEATQGNYDAVAFVNGKQSADRYDLSKQVQEIEWDEMTDAMRQNYGSPSATKVVTIRPLQGNLIDIPIDERGIAVASGTTGNQFDGKPLDEIVPKEIAEQIMGASNGTISGDGLKVGGRGMLEFYDKIVPAAVNKLLKKYGGGKLGSVIVPNMRNQELAEDAERMGMTQADVLDLAEPGEYAAAQPGFPITHEMVKKLESGLPLFQAAPGQARPARGWFDMNRLVIMLNTEADFTTFWHELNHYFLHTYVSIANQGNAPQSLLNDLDVLMRWFGMEGDTQEARLASWNALDIEQQKVHYEALAYNSEIYGFDGKAPSLELRSVFAKISAFIRSVYEDIRDNLNKIYLREFGVDLPVMTPEVREVMDRMLASSEEIKTYQAIQSMVPAYLTQEEANMSDGEWAAYQVMREEAEEAAVMELQKASLRQMAWLAPARSRIVKEMQDKEKDRRKEVRKEAEQEVSRRRVYRAMTYLRRGKLIDAEGVEKEASGTHRLDIDIVRNMYELRQQVERYREPGAEAVDVPELEQAAFPVPEWRKLGTGKYGMLAAEGLSPEMVAEMFGYANGDAMIRDLVEAKPVKEAVEDRTSEIMQRRFGDENTPDARERRIQEALHNEARGRFVAVEWRHMSGATEPVRVMLEAARLAAEDIIARKRIRDIRPAQHEAAEARAARDSMNAMRIGGNPAAAAQAAYTRAKNEVLNAPREDSPAALFAATAAAEIAGEAARAESLQRSADRIAEFREKYGNVEPDILKIRAKRAQLYQNQLAREALKARQEVTKALKDFRKFFRADAKIAQTREMSLVMAARSILAAHGIGRSDMAPSAYLDKLREYNSAVYEAVAPIVARATRERGDYRDMRLEDFRAMAGAVEALWVQARRERTIQVGEDRIAVEAVVAALDRRLEAIGIPEVVPGEKAAPGRMDYAKRFLMQLRSTMRRVESWAEAMDGNDPERPYTRYLWRPIKLAADNFRTTRNNYVKKFVNLISAIEMQDGMIEATEIGYTFGKGNAGIGKAELLGAMLHTGNESNYRKLLLGRNWATLDEEGNLDDSRWVAFVSRMQQQGILTRKDYEFIQASWDLLEEIKPTLQKAHYDLMGFYFKEVEASEVVTPFGTFRGGYVPAATDKFLVSDAVTKAGMAELESDWRNALPSTGMGMTMTRVETYTRPLVLDVRMIATHMDAALRFAMIQPAVADALKVLNDRGFSSRLERVDPTAKTNLLIPWLHRAARQIVSEPGRFRMVDDFWRGVRTRTGMSIMFANLRNAFQQVTGQFPALLKVKPTYLKSANVAYMTSPRQTANMIASLSPFMNELMNSQMFDVQETMNDIVLNPSKFEKAQEWSKKHGYFLQTAFQNSVNIVVWLGAYNQFLAEKAGGLSQERAQAEAIQEANAAVRVTQGSILPEDISAFEAGTPFYRTLTQFSGYFNSLANVNATEFVRTIREMGWRGGKGKLLYIYMFGIAMPALVSDAIVRSLGGGWDDEDEDGYVDVAMDFFFGSQGRLVTAFVPFGSSAYTLLTTAFNDKPYDDRMTSSPSVSSIEASTIGVGKAIVNVVDEDKELTGKNVRDVMTMLSLVTGIPFSAAGRPVGYLVEVGRGKVEPEGPVDVVRGLVTGVATPDSKR